MSEDNFATAPVSIAELRSEKTGKSCDWKPRDALVELLRRIDKGEIAPDQLIVCFSVKGDDGTMRIKFNAACRDALAAVGLLQYVQREYMRGADSE